MNTEDLDLIIRVVKHWNPPLGTKLDDEVRALRNSLNYARRDTKNAQAARDQANIALGQIMTDETGQYEQLKQMIREATK